MVEGGRRRGVGACDLASSRLLAGEDSPSARLSHRASRAGFWKARRGGQFWRAHFPKFGALRRRGHRGRRSRIRLRVLPTCRAIERGLAVVWFIARSFWIWNLVLRQGEADYGAQLSRPMDAGALADP